MSTPRSGLSRDCRAQAAVESLLVLMTLALVVFGGIELSRGVALRQALDSGTQAAARALSLDPAQWDFAARLVGESVADNGMSPGATPVLQVLDAAGSPRSPGWLASSPFGTPFILSAAVPFQADIPFLAPGGLTIRVRHRGSVERYP